MTPEDWQRIKMLLNEALELPPSERSGFLQKVCAGEVELRAELESLLVREQETAGFLKSAEYSSPGLRVGKQILHYEVMGILGEGGMGVVYQARDTRLHRFVALKLLRTETLSDPERKRRFVQEARAASALNHPNIVTIYEIFSDDDLDFIVMEYLGGKTLEKVIGANGLGVPTALTYGLQIADAVSAAHAAGVVHRDLKPGNIMITDGRRVKVLAFGLAKLTGATAFETVAGQATKACTLGGAIVGTVPYMSPEQAEGKPVDARSDIFSFGSMLYEMLTGRRAFQADSDIGILAAILTRQPEPVGNVVLGIPPALDDLVSLCLRKNRDERIQQMSKVKLALEQLIGAVTTKPRYRTTTLTPRRNTHQSRRTDLSQIEQRNRTRFLKRIHNDWIEGVLNRSLYKLVQIKLGIDTELAAVEHPLNAFLQLRDEAPRPLPPGTTVADVFEEHGEALLILGDPGTGKTTLLLELLSQLLLRAEEDVAEPIPVVFNLSSWARRRQSIAKWLT